LDYFSSDSFEVRLIDPPAFSIAEIADLEATSTERVTLEVISHFPRSFTGRDFLVITPEARSTSLLISEVHDLEIISKSDRLIMLKCFLNLAFEKPLNLGILLNSGV